MSLKIETKKIKDEHTIDYIDYITLMNLNIEN